MIKSTEEITILLENNTPEGQALDYKLKLPGNNDGSKKEFLADISSFANTIGGSLIYGVGEEVDENNNKTGYPKHPIDGLDNFSFHDEQSRLEQMISAGVSKRIQGVTFYLFEAPLGKENEVVEILVINIPPSLQKLHMVTFKGSTKFFGRNNTGKFQMTDVDEILKGLSARSEVAQKLRTFHKSRVDDISLNTAPISLHNNHPKVILHLTPLSSVGSLPCDLSVMDMKSRKDKLITFDMDSANDNLVNVDGFVKYYTGSEESTYSLFFRNGIIETVGEFPFNTEGKLIYISTIQKRTLECLESFLEIYQASSITPPFLLFVSFFGVIGYSLDFINDGSIRYDPRKPYKIDRGLVHYPDILNPLFDAFWNSAGWDKAYQHPWGAETTGV
jgi:hypothetical protein